MQKSRYIQTYIDIQTQKQNFQGMYKLNQKSLIVLRHSGQVKFA